MLLNFLPGLAALIHLDVEKDAATAYDMWAATYDHQPENLMLRLDAEIFASLLGNIDLGNKKVADIGCGTGRHWHYIYKKHPGSLTGFDVSKEMLGILKEKYPGGETRHLDKGNMNDVPDKYFDAIISTLTIAHLPDINEAVTEWGRILKEKSEIIITDFHPDLLANGGKRTFRFNNRPFTVVNNIYPVELVEHCFLKNGFHTAAKIERYIDERVKEDYVQQHAVHIYEKFRGLPVIYGLHLIRNGVS